MTYFNTNTFSIGSSPYLTIYPLVILYLNYIELPPECQKSITIHPMIIAIFLPIVLGVVLSAVYQVIRSTTLSRYYRIIVSGTISAFILSILLDYMNVYDEYLLASNTHGIHIFIIVFYAIVFAILGEWLFQ